MTNSDVRISSAAYSSLKISGHANWIQIPDILKSLFVLIFIHFLLRIYSKIWLWT